MRLLRIDRPPTLPALLLAASLPIGAGCGRQGEPASPPVVAPGGAEAPGLGDAPRPRPGKSPVPAPADAEPPGAEELAAMSADELVALARTIPDREGRLPALEAALEKEPDHPQALLLLTEAAERTGLDLVEREGRREESKPYLYRAAEAARAYRRLEKPLTADQRLYFARVFYNEACNFALDDQPDRAIASLEEALGLGFNHPVIHTDPELETLHDRDDFQELKRQVPADPDAGPLADDQGLQAE